MTGIQYRILNDGVHHTVAALQLRLIDPASPVHEREFEVELPPPDSGHAEFVVLRSRFDAALRRGWAAGDSCQVRLDSSCS